MSKNKYITEEENAGSGHDQSGAEPVVENASQEQEQREKKSRLFSGRTFVQIMNGEFLTKDNFLNNLPFTFFIGFLLVMVIAWGYYGETVTKHEVQLEKELGELNSEFYTLTADYNMQRGRRQIALRLEPTGVKESVSSPKKIRVRKYVFP